MESAKIGYMIAVFVPEIMILAFVVWLCWKDSHGGL